MQQGKERLDAESASAKKQLAATADGLAGEIVQAVLGRSAA
jgi:F0F1-type ATP synthase membrane subunit b/b'